jgi:hypothetical protein
MRAAMINRWVFAMVLWAPALSNAQNANTLDIAGLFSLAGIFAASGSKNATAPGIRPPAYGR